MFPEQSGEKQANSHNHKRLFQHGSCPERYTRKHQQDPPEKSLVQPDLRMESEIQLPERQNNKETDETDVIVDIAIEKKGNQTVHTQHITRIIHNSQIAGSPVIRMHQILLNICFCAKTKKKLQIGTEILESHVSQRNTIANKFFPIHSFRSNTIDS
jgi:hypothetical protein